MRQHNIGFGRSRALLDLCVEIARGNIGGERFNQLLLETGICLDEMEWEQANRLLGKSDQMLSMIDNTPPLC